MKPTLLFKKSLILMVTVAYLSGCGTAEDIISASSSNKASNYSANANIYDTLTITGSFVSDINSYSIVLKDAQGTTVNVPIAESSVSEIKGFIPKDVVPAKYTVSLSKGSSVAKLQDVWSEDVEINVRKRPIITASTQTSFKPGAVITLTGANFLNGSGNTSYDPKVWIMATGYSNSVSKIVINEAGTSATVTISSSLTAGKYELFVTSGNGSTDVYEPWSNPVEITVTQ